MSVPPGFLELTPPGSLGPFVALKARGTLDPDYPAFVRVRLYWGKATEPIPARVLAYPATVLYGGPCPRAWAASTLPGWVRDWAATLAPPGGASSDGSQWLVQYDGLALLVPHEALAWPFCEFRWVWVLEQAPGSTYEIEGTVGEPEFRNARTGQLEAPPPLGAGSTQVAGCTCPPAPASTAKSSTTPSELESDSDGYDPRVVTWLTEEDWANHGGRWPWWITNEYSVGAVAGLHGRRELAASLRPLWDGYKLGGAAGRMQCPETTRIGGIPSECGLASGHPGPHMCGPPELGQIWTRDVSPGAPGDTSVGDAIGALPSRTDQQCWNILEYKSKKTGKLLYRNQLWATLDAIFSRAVSERVKWDPKGSSVNWLTWDGKKWVDGWTARSTIMNSQIRVALADKPSWAR